MTTKTEADIAIALYIGLGPMLTLFLALLLCTLIDELTYSWRRRRQESINDKLSARLAKPSIKGAPSSIRVERLTLNQKVPGSNPGGLTIKENDLRRRIQWHLDERTAIVFAEKAVLPEKFQWRALGRPKDESIVTQSSYTRFRDFKPGEDQFELLWDGQTTENFKSVVDLKLFVIRLTYILDKDVLIPSEILADANLVYATRGWIDVWGTVDRSARIIECPREIYRPSTRNIRFLDRLVPRTLHAKLPTKHVPVTHIPARLDAWKRAKPVEIPDEKCFYTFRAGGFYEKGQKDPEETCKGEEKVV